MPRHPYPGVRRAVRVASFASDVTRHGMVTHELLLDCGHTVKRYAARGARWRYVYCRECGGTLPTIDQQNAAATSDRELEPLQLNDRDRHFIRSLRQIRREVSEILTRIDTALRGFE